jgi:hypothetical protein
LQYGFKAKAKQSPPPRLDKPFLSLRVFPSPAAGAKASIKDLVPSDFEIKPADVWVRVGELAFSEKCPQTEAVNKIEIVRYESSMLAYGCDVMLHPAKEVFQL